MSKANKIKAPKGMNDILPTGVNAEFSTPLWDRIVDTFRRVMESYGYRRVLIPAVEDTSLFARGIGEGTDIVSKEMFSFTDRGDRPLTLRPEGTAGVVRAYIERNIGQTSPTQRWWYYGPMFRAERPQQGRYRQFYQVGGELLGVSGPVAEVEVLEMLWNVCRELGLEGVKIGINTLGDAESRQAYRTALQAYFREHLDTLGEGWAEKIDANPLRVLDSKNPVCREVSQGAPDILASLSDSATEHFERLQTLADARGIPVVREPRLVRGLDYYTGLLFEFTQSAALGAQDAVLGGGRYDKLVSELGGPATPALGFAAGVERLAIVLSQKSEGSVRTGPDLYIVPMEGLELEAFELAQKVRQSGNLRVEVDVGGGKIKSQMKRADRSGARTALVLGEDEVKSGRGLLKDLGVSSQTEVDLNPDALHTMLDTMLDTRLDSVKARED